MRPESAILIGVALALPFFLMNGIVVARLEPFYSFFGSIGVLAARPLPTVAILLFLGLVGGCIAISPLFRRSLAGSKSYLWSVLLGLALIVFFLVIGAAFGEELYRCEVLRTPNCD